MEMNSEGVRWSVLGFRGLLGQASVSCMIAFWLTSFICRCRLVFKEASAVTPWPLRLRTQIGHTKRGDENMTTLSVRFVKFALRTYNVKQVFEQLLQEVYNQAMRNQPRELDRIWLLSCLSTSKTDTCSIGHRSESEVVPQYKDVQGQRCAKDVQRSWVLTCFSNLFAKASKNAKERRREPGGIQIQTWPYQTFLWFCSARLQSIWLWDVVANSTW